MLNSPLGGRYGIGGALGRSWKREAGGFVDPTSIAGLQLWLDFSDATTLFADAGTTPVSSDGDAIYQANDKSGNSRHATQSSINSRPLYKTGIHNGLSVAKMDGVNDYFVGDPFNFSAMTLFCVVDNATTDSLTYLSFSATGAEDFNGLSLGVRNNDFVNIDKGLRIQPTPPTSFSI